MTVLTVPSSRQAPRPSPATPWAPGRFDGRPGSARLLFGRTFEDPSIEIELFPATGIVLCIASAGDTPRALATSGLSVIAVDINPAQIAETRRRLAGLPARRGAADRLLALGRLALLPLGWRRRRVASFCRLDDRAEQRRQWTRLTRPAVRAVVRAALSPRLLGLVYGEPFAAIVDPRFGDELLDRIGRRIGARPNDANPWLGLLLTGQWSASEAPVAADAVDVRLGDVVDVLEQLPAASLDGISLSNILDGPDRDYAERLLAAARRAGRCGAPIVVRSFIANGSFESQRLADADRSLLWGAIEVHRATGAPT